MAAQPDPLDAALANLAENFTAKSHSPVSDLDTETALDRTLQDLQASPGSPQTEALLAELCQEFQQSAEPTYAHGDDLAADLAAIAAQFPSPSTQSADPDLDRALSDQVNAQMEAIHQHRHQAWFAQQQQLRLEQKAQQWLDALDPYSNEGLWFAEFAAHYPSELDAAVDYLTALLKNALPTD
ncbi:MAG: hypothetical protein AAGG51_24145 [Cyanobacteria bacterium P01_G01_bin.54]